MGPEDHQLERRTDLECRGEIEDSKNYLLKVAQELDRQITRDKEAGIQGVSHEVATLTTQIGIIQNRLIHACDGKLRRERPNAIFHEISSQVNNVETERILLERVKKGIHDERD